MLPDFRKLSQKGYISLVLIVFAILIAALIFPYKFPSQNLSQSDGLHYCREFLDPADAPIITILIDSKSTATSEYRMIKMNVPILEKKFQPGEHVTKGSTVFVPALGKQFQILYPKGGGGRSYDFNTEDGKIGNNGIIFADYGLVFLLHLNDDGSIVSEGNGKEALDVIDIYQDVTKDPIPKAENILKCVDIGAESVVDPVVIVPEQRVSDNREQVQMEWFVVKQAKLLPKSWWTPECKPAIYLYPDQKQLVNVKVTPLGQLTYTDPLYDEEKGWTVEANPNGALFAMNNKPLTNNYLYYESKIRDEAIQKPAKGWVVKFQDLEGLYKNILPKLGLNEKETKDFVDYWTKALPQAPYYFMGIVDPENVDEIEKLEITPKPDSINRVRVYFERLDSFKRVEPPVLALPSSLLPSHSFRVVEWGGMVKNDPDHPFTCSQ